MNALSSIPGFGKTLGGAFYLYGADHFRKEATVRALIEAHLDPATGDFNLDPLRGTDVDAETLASVLATPPMMAEWRVVVLRDVEGLAPSKKAREELLRVVENPPPGLALIMSCTVPSGSKAKFYSQLSRHGRSLEFKAITEADVPGWLMARATEVHGIEIDVGAARALGSAIGTNLGILSMELEKLADFIGERTTVTLADVKAAGTQLPAQDRWEWFDLVADRKLDEACRTLPILLGQGESGVGLAIALTSQLLRIGVAAEQGASGLESALPKHQKWLAKRVMGQARRWNLEEIDHALAGLLDVDRLLKASPQSDEHLLETWLLGLRVRAAAA